MSKKSQRSAAGGAKKKVDRPRRQKDQRPPQQAGPGPQGRKGPFNNGPGNNFNQGNQGFVRFPGNFTPGQGYGPSHHQSPQQFGSPGNGPQFRGKKPPQQNNQQNFHQNNQNFQPNNQNFQPNNQNFEQARSSMDAPNSQAAKSLPVQRPPRNFQVDGVLQRKFYKVSYYQSFFVCKVVLLLVSRSYIVTYLPNMNRKPNAILMQIK